MDWRRFVRVLRAVLDRDFDFEAPSHRALYGLSLFLAGVGTGVLVGMLFAPTSGEEVRSKVGERAREGFETARKRVRTTAHEFTHKAPSGPGSTPSSAERSDAS